MITLNIPDREELYDAGSNMFLPPIPGGKFTFEHSLKSLTLWEEKYRVPFLHTELTDEQSIDYIVLMCTTEGFNPLLITRDVLDTLVAYINYNPTATTITDEKGGGGQGKIITSEVIYAWMAGASVPFECDTWNLKKLLTLLRVVASQQNPPKKRTYEEQLDINRRLNEQRKEELKTKG